jgi:type VI secretion system protein ImpG
MLQLEGPVTMLVRPSVRFTLPQDDGSLWRLVSAFAPSHAALLPSGLAALRDLLYQFGATASPEASHHVRGIIGLNCVTIMPALQIEGVPVPLIVPGIQVMLTIDEQAFNGDALHTFALLMERYFLRYVGLDCMQLVLLSRRGAEIWRGEPLTREPVVASL